MSDDEDDEMFTLCWLAFALFLWLAVAGFLVNSSAFGAFSLVSLKTLLNSLNDLVF